MGKNANDFDFAESAPKTPPRHNRSRTVGVALGIAAGVLLPIVLCGGAGVFILRAAKQTPAPPPSADAPLRPSDMSLRAWQVQGTKGEAYFRLSASLLPADDAQLKVRFQDAEPFTTATGRVAKDSPDGKRLFDLLKDGADHEVGVRLRMAPAPEFGSPDVHETTIVRFEGGR